jgi:hypothetical protein
MAKVLEQDPASASRWCDLGEMLLNSGDIKLAGYCFSRAVVLSPYSAPILLRAFNFHIRLEEYDRALEFSRQLMSGVREYDTILFSQYDRLGLPQEQILENGLPAQKRAGLAYFRHQLSRPNALTEDCQKTWEWIMAHGFAEDPVAAEYVSFLVSRNVVGPAKHYWIEYLGSRRGEYPEKNALFNGDFERPPLACPLDWQMGKVDGAEPSRDGAISKTGRWSLRVSFDGTRNVAFQNIGQMCLVNPGRHRLAFWIRTASLSTDQGLHMRVFDAEKPARLDVMGQNFVGTRDWTREELEFSVPPTTRIVQVQLVRLPSLKFDNKIAGTAWIDDVRLTP